MEEDNSSEEEEAVQPQVAANGKKPAAVKVWGALVHLLSIFEPFESTIGDGQSRLSCLLTAGGELRRLLHRGGARLEIMALPI